MSRTMIERHYANVAGSPFTVSRTIIERHYANVAGSPFTVSRTMIERHMPMWPGIRLPCHAR